MANNLTTEDIEELFETSNRQIREETTEFHRYLMSEIDWRDRLICIKGARGTGKTTLLRQRIKEQFGVDSPYALYASLDDLWFARHDLKDLINYLYEHGFSHVFLRALTGTCIGLRLSRTPCAGRFAAYANLPLEEYGIEHK